MTCAQKNYATADIFGKFIASRRVVPDRKEIDEGKAKRKEKELFETVDDYIEQA